MTGLDETGESFDGPCLEGRYVLGRRLGRGSAGEVRLGWDRVLHRLVAVKILAFGDPTEVRNPLRLRNEAMAVARLNSPNIVRLFDFGEHDGAPFLVMERLPGLSWAYELRSSRPSPARVLGVMDDVLQGLEVAHRAGIVHRDVKPANVLLAEDGTAKLADFGLARGAGLDSLTTDGNLLGTLPYLPPERLSGAPATADGDVWALGIMLYESLAGRRPFTGDAPADVVFAIMRGEFVPLADLRPDLPPEVHLAVARALKRDPVGRATAAEVRMTLLPASDRPGLPSAPLPPAPLPPTADLAIGRTAIRPRRRAVVGAVIGILSGAAALVVALAVHLPGNSAVNAEPPGGTPSPTSTTGSVVSPGVATGSAVEITSTGAPPGSTGAVPTSVTSTGSSASPVVTVPVATAPSAAAEGPATGPEKGKKVKTAKVEKSKER